MKTIKKIIALFALAALAACPLTSFSGDNIQDDPAYLQIDKVLDLKANPPQVNVNLPRFLLNDALSGLSDTNLDLVNLVKDVKLIRVVVYDGIKTNQDAVKKAMKALRTELDAKWTSIVNVSEENENVGVYVMGDKSGEKVGGVAVLVFDGNDAVIANVVGNVSVGKLIKLATQSGKLPKDLLKQLGNGGGEPHPAAAGSKKHANEFSPATNAPAVAPDTGTK